MTSWYDPRRLLSIGVRAAVSTLFGEFADRREAMVAARPIDPNQIDAVYNFSTKQELWFDFVADTGDGWNPTYAIARLLSAPALQVSNFDAPLPMGSILVMGGDQVYPTASRADYELKLVAPYDTAATALSKSEQACLFAIPGNHDWYDGLVSFLGEFCARRTPTNWSRSRTGKEIGGRQTQQTRSYFALKLPNGWWLWGADIQLRGYIDQPQIDFFEHVAREWMEPGSRLILCTGQPSWVYADPESPNKEFANFSYLERLAGLANRQHDLRLILTGDSHHYARYIEDERHYITAGGGGAFLHPTHHLKDNIFTAKHPPPGIPAKKGVFGYSREFRIAKDLATGQPSLFPSPAVSKRLALCNIWFAFHNWQFACALWGVAGLLTWLLAANARIVGTPLSQALSSTVTFWDSVRLYMATSFISPWPTLLVVALLAGYCAFAKFRVPWLAGVLNGAAQLAAIVLTTVTLARVFPAGDTLLVVLSALIGGTLAATIMGLYLLISLNMFGAHWNEAFSSLRIEGYKCFLRMHIGHDGSLTIYPIGLVNVPKDDRPGEPTNPPLYPHLVEAPIVIPAADRARPTTGAV